MGDTFQAGSVVAQLKAEIAEFEKGFAKAKATLKSFGDQAEQTGTTAGEGATRMAAGFDRADAANVRLISRIARVSSAILGLQSVVASFTDGPKGSVSQFSEGLKAASVGLSTFATLAVALPGPAGVGIGAIAGLTAATVSFGKAMGEALETAEEMNKVLKKLADHKFSADIEKQFRGLTLSGTSLEAADLQAQIKATEEALKQQLVDRSKVKSFADRGAIAPGFTEETQLASLEASAKKIEEQALAISDKRRALAIAEARKDREALSVENNVTLKQTQALLKAGLIDPIDIIKANAQAADAALKQLLEQQAELEKVAPGLGNVLGTDISTAIAKSKAAKGALVDANEVKRQADNFGGAIGEGLRKGILNGESALQTLANIGNNLFENMVNDLAKNLQTSLSDAFQSIAGAGGAALGGLLTAGLGVAGAILGKKGKSSESFNAVQSQITSTAAVRGIVAGPSSVAIATVGEDIARAFEPCRDLLAQILAAIQSQSGSGRSPGRGPSIAGSVATT